MADIAAEAEAFLQSMQEQVEAGQPAGELPSAEPPADPSAADLIAQAQAAAASFSAQIAEQVQQQQFQNGLPQAVDPEVTPPVADAAAQDGSATEGRRKRRNRWGNPSGTDGAEPAPSENAGANGTTAEPAEGTGKRKRRSRWEEPEESTDLSITSHIPKEIMLPGGIKVGETVEQSYHSVARRCMLPAPHAQGKPVRPNS